MLRVLSFLAFVVAIGGVLSFVAAQSGELVIMMAGNRIVMPIFTAVCVLLVALGLIFLAWWLIKTLITAPHLLRTHIDGRRERRGYQALSQGLIAAMSGNVKATRRLTKQSNNLLHASQEPLLILLRAETKRLELDYQGAEDIFRTMLDDPRMRLIGLKGLYREAMRQGDNTRAAHYAAEAVKTDASLEWAIRASITKYALEDNWQEALTQLEHYEKAASKPRRELGKPEITHWRVVLMCAKVLSFLHFEPEEDGENTQFKSISATTKQNKLEQARDTALQAHRLEPDFVPAAWLAAKILSQLGEHKKADKLIETFWRKSPHPDLGVIYLEGASNKKEQPLEKLHRALKLGKYNPEDRFSQFLVARAALEAGDIVKARQHAEKLSQIFPTEGAFLLLAEIYAAQDPQQKDHDKVRNCLAQAVHAAADFAWIVDGQIVENWVAISPLTHHIGECEWRQPAKHLTPSLRLPAPINHQEIAPNIVLSSPIETIEETSSSLLPSSNSPQQDETDHHAVQFPKDMKRDCDKKTKVKTQELEQFVEPSATKTALDPSAPFLTQPTRAEKNSSPPQRTNSPPIHPTRIVVDDPGIGED